MSLQGMFHQIWNTYTKKRKMKIGIRQKKTFTITFLFTRCLSDRPMEDMHMSLRYAESVHNKLFHDRSLSLQ